MIEELLPIIAIIGSYSVTLHEMLIGKVFAKFNEQEERLECRKLCIEVAAQHSICQHRASSRDHPIKQPFSSRKAKLSRGYLSLTI
jgi:hypothetical protein